MVRLSLLSAWSLACLGALCGCQTATPPEGPAQHAAPAGGASAPAPMGFADIGDRRITEIIAPESFLVIRCRYAVGPEERESPLDEPMAKAPERARKDLSGILLLLEEKLAAAPASIEDGDPDRQGGAAGGRAGALRVYELAVGETWALALTVTEPCPPAASGSNAGVVVRANRREIALDASAPELLAHLRGLSFKALRRAMAKPRQALDWHYAALAGFLESSASLGPKLLESEGESLPGLRREILEHLASEGSPGDAVGSILARARFFKESEVAPHLHSQRLPLRLLALTREGWHGNRPAMAEILTLSLEYTGQDRLFEQAVRSLFPAALNPLLYLKCPEGPRAVISFVREVRSRFEKAEHSEGLGWTVEGSKGAP